MATTSNHILRLLLVFAFLLINIDRSTTASPSPSNVRFKCPTTSICSCKHSANTYVISCPSVTVEATLGKELKIKCTTPVAKVYIELPKMNLGDMALVQFRQCPLPQSTSVHRILKRMGVRRIHSLLFSTRGGDMRASLQRQHLIGLVDVQRLSLTDNGLTSLPANLLDGVGNLTSLNLRSNKLDMPLDLLDRLPQLERLELGDNQLSQLAAGTFRNQHKLMHLNLWGNRLRNLTKDSFIGASAVAALDLSANHIESLPADVFEYLVNLAQINLSANRFASLPVGLFAANKQLQQIRLMNNRNNELESLPSELLANLPGLEEVSIVRCNLRRLPADMFRGSPNIRNITLAANALTTLPLTLFDDQSNLLDLDLSDNLLVELPDDSFIGTPTLTVLRLSNNQLENISGSLFRDLDYLQELYMDNNRLVGIHQHAFATTGALEKLRLENNRLSFDEASSPFQKRTSLKELNLRNNSITNILMDWNYHTLQLRDLDLSYNQITRLHYAQLEFLSSRITVNLTHNTITEINLSALEAIAALNDPIVRAHSTHLILNDNPLHCDCLLVHFMQFYRHELAPKIRKHFKITIDDLRCASPERVTFIQLLFLSLNLNMKANKQRIGKEVASDNNTNIIIEIKIPYLNT